MSSEQGPAKKRKKSSKGKKDEKLEEFKTMTAELKATAQHHINHTIPGKIHHLHDLFQDVPIFQSSDAFRNSFAVLHADPSVVASPSVPPAATDIPPAASPPAANHAQPKERKDDTSLSPPAEAKAMQTDSSDSSSDEERALRVVRDPLPVGVIPGTSKPPPTLLQLATSNRPVKKLMDCLKAELLEHIETVSCVKLYVQLNVPRMEDGNNFGVGVQEEVLEALGKAEDQAFGQLEAMTKYHITRANIMAKCTKYPTVGDYRASVREWDEKYFASFQLACLDLRNQYATLYDKLTKNIDKIRKPRNDQSGHLNMY